MEAAPGIHARPAWMLGHVCQSAGSATWCTPRCTHAGNATAASAGCSTTSAPPSRNPGDDRGG